jgi:hypothetical protein
VVSLVQLEHSSGGSHTVPRLRISLLNRALLAHSKLVEPDAAGDRSHSCGYTSDTLLLFFLVPPSLSEGFSFSEETALLRSTRRSGRGGGFDFPFVCLLAALAGGCCL